MSTATVIVMTPGELENLIRRVVREELSHAPQTAPASILDDWSQEGPDDPEGDEQLAQEALAILEEYRDRPEAWIKWEDLKKELARAEAAGELPD